MNSPIIAHPDFYASLVFNSSDLISILSPEGIYKYVSNSSMPILGFAPEELIGKNALSFVHPDDVAVAAQALSKLQFRPSIHIPPFRFQDKNGRWRWLDCVIKDMTADPSVQGIVSNARDITEKVEAEDQSEMREAYYSSLFRNHPDGVFSLNLEGIVETANLGLQPVLGLPLNEIIGRPYTDFVAPGERNVAKANEAFFKALNGVPSRLELEAINKVQGNIWLNITAIPVVLNGQVVGMHGIAKDITELRKNQTLIEEQAELLNSVFSSITEGFFVVDKNWHITYVNPYFITFFGLQLQPVMGRELWEALPELKAHKFYEIAMDAAQSGKTAHFHDSFPGRQQVLRFAVYPFSGGVSFYFDDITEEKKKGQELFDLALVASKTTNGVVIMDPEGKIEWVNDGFCRITGYSRQEVIGQVPSKLLQGPETSPEVSAYIYQQYAAKVPFSQEVLNYTKSGEIIWFHIDVTPVFDDEGNLIKYVAIENDITELKKKEAERVKLTENLVRRNQDLQQFTYIVSHNLRAPVANLVGLSRMLNIEGKHSGKFDKALSKLTSATTHLDMVISDLSKILSPLRNTGSAIQEKININAVINEVATGLQEQLESARAGFRNKIPPELVLAGSHAYFYSIFNNLLTNALKYAHASRPVEILVSQEESPGKIAILFADNGIGMDMEEVKGQLFQLYKRFHVGAEGRGIGLYLVKTQVEAMGGNISVESKPGVGTTFILTFSV